jgi:TPR repeat protein
MTARFAFTILIVAFSAQAAVKPEDRAQIVASEVADREFKRGWDYAYGQGADRNPALAARLFRAAAEKGNARAGCELARLYRDGNGVPQSDAKALLWYHRFAGRSGTGADYSLAEMYAESRGGDFDYAPVLARLTALADRGDVSSQYAVALMYEHGGEGISRDDNKAFDWYQKAADQALNTPDADFKLANMYEQGRGVGQDYAKALLWYEVARGPEWGRHIDKEWQDKVVQVQNNLISKMSPTQVGDAKRLEGEWFARHPWPKLPL